MSITFWLQFVLVCIIGAMSPGPSVALIIRNSVRFSRAAGVLTAIGHACGIGIYASLAILGLHFILTTNLFIFNAIQIIGSIFLLGLGIMFLIDRSTGLQIEETQKNHNSFFQGLIIAIINPKILIWFTAIFSNFITINSSTITNFILVINDRWHLVCNRRNNCYKLWVKRILSGKKTNYSKNIRFIVDNYFFKFAIQFI